MITRLSDHRGVDLAKLHLDVAFGRSGGQIIWQPRILAWITDKLFAGERLPAPYTGMSRPEIYRSLGCSDRIYEFTSCFIAQDDPEVRTTRKALNDLDYEVVWHTPVGVQRALYRKVPGSPWHEPLKWPIASEEDLKIAAWRNFRRHWIWDQSRFEQLCEEWRGIGAPTMYICRTTVQQLFVEDSGVEGGTYALIDYPAAREEYFDALNTQQERMIEVINASPIQIINFGDNVHSSTTPPHWFRKYLLPVYQRRCELLHKAGKFVHAHWDGNCRPLLPLARETGLDGIEAITPAPQGDVTLEETKAALGDMYLLDGIPAVFFKETYPEQVLVDCVKKCIELFAPRLILGISDEIASDGDIERVRLVGEIVDEYNAAVS